MTRTVKIGKHGANAGWWILRDALAADLPFTNSGGSFHGEPVSYTPGTGRLADQQQFQVDRPTYVIFSYATPIAWRRADGTWATPVASYSATTSGHQGKAFTAIGGLERPYVPSPLAEPARPIADPTQPRNWTENERLGKYASFGAYEADLLARIDELV